MRQLLHVSLTLLAAASPAQTRSRWCEYVPRALERIIAQHDSAARRASSIVSRDQFPTRANFRYTGNVRSIPPERTGFLAHYFEFMNRPWVAHVFQREVEFRDESGKTYWLPVEETTLGHFRGEVERGDRVSLFVLWAGAYGPIDGPKDWVFLVNEFTSAQSASYWTRQLASCNPSK